MIKLPWDDYLTKDERKLLVYIGAFLIIGMIVHYSGNSLVYAKRMVKEKQQISESAVKDTLILIDIRKASSHELTLLPGIGPKRAETIIAYRNSKQFESPEELLNIKGIGAKTYQKMKPMLLAFGNTGAGVEDKQKLQDIQPTGASTDKDSEEKDKQGLDGTDGISKKEHKDIESEYSMKDNTVHLNSASREELMSLTGIGEKKADAIIAYRKQIGKFSDIEQLLDVKGIGIKTLDKNRSRLSL